MLGYRDEPVVPEDAPPSHDAAAAWELFVTCGGSATEKHLRAYLDELAFRRNRRRRPRSEAFLALASAIAATPPRTYEMIGARGEPEGYALSIWTYSRRSERLSGLREETACSEEQAP
jgi:hypothetical protein